MSAAARSLIQAVAANGGRITVVGNRLAINPGKAGKQIADELRLHKAEIIELLELAQSKQGAPPLPAGVRLIQWEPRQAPFALSKYAVVTDAEKFIATTLKQLDARLQRTTWVAGNWSLSELVCRLESAGCYVVIEDPHLARH
jgi:glutathione S-transferase